MKMTPPMAAHRLERGCGVWGCDSVGECLAYRNPRVSSLAPQKAGTVARLESQQQGQKLKGSLAI